MEFRNAFDMTGSVTVITGGGRGISFYSAAALGFVICFNNFSAHAVARHLGMAPKSWSNAPS
jgi:hypothetical protein